MNRSGFKFRAACTGLIPLVLAVDITTPRYPSGDGTASEGLALVRLDPGTELEVVTRGGSRFRGRFRGIARMSEAAYEAHADTVWSAAAAGALPPVPGDSVTVQPLRGDPWKGVLTGYAYRGAEVLREGRETPTLIGFERLAELHAEGDRVWTRRELNDEASAGRLPAFSEVVIEIHGQHLRVPADRILLVSYREPSGQWVAGALLGGVLGAVLVLFLLGQALSDGPSGCEGPGPEVLPH